VGNIHHASNGTQPGIYSYNGRYSDGRVWIEYIQQFFNLPPLNASLDGGLDFAYGGATVDNAYINSFSTYLNANVPSVSEQITSYLEQDENIAASRLHVLFAGYNDYWWYVYRNYTTSEGQDFDLKNVYNTVANNFLKQVLRLYNNGGRMFLVGNVVNMSSWAEAALQTQEVLDNYDILVHGHNSLLLELLLEFQEEHDDVTIYQFDAFDTFKCISQRKTFFGLQNVNDPCHPSDSEACGDIFSYEFWDYYHPTTHAHQIASMSLLESIYRAETKKMRGKSANLSLVRSSLRH
jgi:phospholipase/lecithinase/hemolysin